MHRHRTVTALSPHCTLRVPHPHSTITAPLASRSHRTTAPHRTAPPPCPARTCVVLQVMRPFETDTLNTLERAALIVQNISLWMALLWLDPLFAPGTTMSFVLVVFWVTIQGLLVCGFLVVLCRLMHFHAIDYLEARMRTALRRARTAENDFASVPPTPHPNYQSHRSVLVLRLRSGCGDGAEAGCSPAGGF